MDPYIVYRGKRMQQCWKGETPDCPEIGYAVADRGWMTADIFENWLESVFLPFLRAKGDGPALLVLDGHVSHVGFTVVETAKNANLTIIRLPPHTTDVLQPVDVACFGPVKAEWNKQTYDHVARTAAKEAMDNAKFATMLSRVWRCGLSPENVKAGFEDTGTFPPDRTKYRTSRFNSDRLEVYNQWIADGRLLTPDGLPNVAFQVWEADKDGPAYEVDFKFLERTSGGGPLRWKWPAVEDRSTISANRIFEGPYVPTIDESTKALQFIFAADTKAKKAWQILHLRGLPSF